jgi:hypothetical protein
MFTRGSIEYNNFTQDAKSLILGQIITFGN